MGWDFELYYKSAVSSTPGMQRLKDPCDPGIFRGRAPASEIETTNIKNLIDTKDPAFFIDVHSHGRKLMFSWATETNQSATPTQNFTNANWDRTGPMAGRDGTAGALYGEFFPNAAPDRLLDDHIAIGNAMRDAILNAAGANAVARTESTYTVTNSTGIGYMSPGSIDDYAFARQFSVVGARSTRSFCMECGSDTNGEGGFHPDYVKKFPKIEREIHAALHALLKEAVRRAPAPAAAPARPPAPSGTCLIATAVYGSESHPAVVRLRAQRDLLRGLPGWRGAAARSVIALYYRSSPPIARFLQSRPEAARLVKRTLVAPAARLLALLTDRVGR